MAKESRRHAPASLRALTIRISSSPPQQLPSIAPQIAASVWKCRATLAIPDEIARSQPDAVQSANRFRATISQLLQARTVEERWAAVVLVKAAVEAGGVEAISKAAGWTKTLIAVLKKNDPPTTKCMVIIVLTRIFTLTWHDTNLVREIATPNLPSFVQACLTAIGKAVVPGTLLHYALESFVTLLPRHPTVFRTYENQIHALLMRILSSTPSTNRPDSTYSEIHRAAASRLLVLLHHCASKQGGPEKWDESFKAAVTAAKTTCDRIFRSINETRVSSAGVEKSRAASGELENSGSDAAGLSQWHGMHAGTERLLVLLDILSAHMSCHTSGITSIRLGIVFDLLQRLLDIDVGMREQSSHFNPQVPKDEREQLFEIIPEIHTSALRLLDIMLYRFNDVMFPALPSLLEPLCNIFATEHEDEPLRAAMFRFTLSLVARIGPSLTTDSLVDLSTIMRSCCEDLLPANGSVDRIPVAGKINGISQSQRQINGAIGINSPSTSQTSLLDFRSAASDLLPILLSELDQSKVPPRLRTRMEQTALLSRHKDALVASVLNPPRRSHGTSPHSSLLPLLAKEFPECAEVEALLRPRFPVVGAGKTIDIAVEEGDGNEYERSEDEGDDREEDTGDGLDREIDGNINGYGLPNQESPNLSLQYNLRSSGTVPEEVFSTAPEHISQTPTQGNLNKRPAADTSAVQESNAKRLRASPVASALASDTSPILPGASAASTETEEIPVTAGMGGSAQAQTAVLPAQHVPSNAQGDDGGSDDSDMEIPPLTMESDSEVEE